MNWYRRKYQHTNDRENIMTAKSKFTASYAELNWNIAGFDNIKNRKLMLGSTIWDEFIKDRYLYIKILYFKRYTFSYCSKRITAYKKILKSDDLPSAIKNAQKISEEIEIISTKEYAVYAMETIVSTTKNYFEDTCSLLHDTKNECFVILGNTEEFIPHEHWLNIYNNISNNTQYLPDSILQILLNYINTTDALMRTYGFFDDAEIGFSLFERKQ